MAIESETFFFIIGLGLRFFLTFRLKFEQNFENFLLHVKYLMSENSVLLEQRGQNIN